MGVGIVFAFFLPEYPHNARLLTLVERDYAVWRLEKEAGAGEAHDELSHMKSFLLALKDVRVSPLSCLYLIYLLRGLMADDTGLHFDLLHDDEVRIESATTSRCDECADA